MAEHNMQRAIEAFAHAHALTDMDEREAFLVELEGESSWLRREVESLLDVETTSDGPSETQEPKQERPRVPGCKILEELGRGGFGTVYRAQRDSHELEPVAIKVLQADRNSQRILERFQRERLLHARMKSQYVARVLDVGTTEQGDPYLMMELVEGARTLIKFAEQERLSIPERLELFRKVCLGIEHLHVNGIYHRDLKPSNLLVGVVDGVSDPKIIDFGLAKDDEEHELTQEGASIGTRGYMSPEQASGEGVDLRTDI